MVLCRLQTKPDKRSLLPLINIRNLLPHRDRPSGTIPAKEGGLAIQGLHPLSFKIRLKLIALPHYKVFHASSLYYIPTPDEGGLALIYSSHQGWGCLFFYISYNYYLYIIS